MTWWLRTAFAELEMGVAEVPGILHNARILEYHKAVSPSPTDDETPWCAAFVNWCLQQAWCPGTKSPLARSFLKWGNSTKPKLGAVTVLHRGKPNSWTGHVGFLIGWNDSQVILLGGNQSNKVSVAAYPVARVLDHRWPFVTSLVQGGN